MEIAFYLGVGFMCGGTGIALTGLGFADLVTIALGGSFCVLGCLLMFVGSVAIV